MKLLGPLCPLSKIHVRVRQSCQDARVPAVESPENGVRVRKESAIRHDT